MFPGRDRHRQLQNVLLLTGILMASLSVSWAQIVVTPDPYLDLSTCRSYWESCDLDNNGAINPLAELGCFVNKLAVRKCNQGTYPTGNQNIVFVTTVCFEITYLECKVDAEIPVNADDPTLYNVCFKMDRTISQRCRDGTQPTPSPVTAMPTFSTNTNVSFVFYMLRWRQISFTALHIIFSNKTLWLHSSLLLFTTTCSFVISHQLPRQCHRLHSSITISS